MKTLSAIVLSVILFFVAFSVQPVSANPPDAHQQAMEIHNQHHQQAMEASRRAEQAHLRFVEDTRRSQNGWHGDFNGRKVRRLNQAGRHFYYTPYNETDLQKRLREKREARREARRSRVQNQGETE